MTFKPIGDIQVGDEVMGFASRNGGADFSNASRNSLCTATVLAVKRRRAPVVRLRMESGREIRCTPDHQWLTRRSEFYRWKYSAAEVGTCLASIIDPSPEVPNGLEREAGWLAGMYDGEGSNHFLAQYKAVNPETYQRIAELAVALGIALTPTPRGFQITGGRQGYVDFLNLLRPVRRDGLEAEILGRTLIRPPDRILGIQLDSDDEEVACLTTTTGNYVVWGYASHNSSAHPERIEELMEWPYRRFIKAFDAFQRRSVCEDFRGRRTAHIAALYANTNYDSGENDRGAVIQSVELAYEQLIADAWNGTTAKEREAASVDTPFMRAAQRAIGAIAPPILPGEEAFGALPG